MEALLEESRSLADVLVLQGNEEQQSGNGGSFMLLLPSVDVCGSGKLLWVAAATTTATVAEAATALESAPALGGVAASKADGVWDLATSKGMTKLDTSTEMNVVPASAACEPETASNLLKASASSSLPPSSTNEKSKFQHSIFPNAASYHVAQAVMNTKRSMMLPMLADWNRNIVFENAIREGISKIRALNPKENVVVLDIGCGTGLLSMFAYRHGADKILALEMNLGVSITASSVIKMNKMEDKIEVINLRSDEFSLQDTKPSIVVGELLDSLLIAEGIIPSFRDIQQRLPKEERCLFIPNNGTIFGVIVQCDALISSLYESGFYWSERNSLETYCSYGDSDGGDLNQSQPSYLRIRANGIKSLIPLSEVMSIAQFDFSNLLNEGEDTRHFVDVETTALREGQAQFLLLYWNIGLLAGSDLQYTTNPWIEQQDYFQDHWHQTLIRLPSVSETSILSLEKGDRVRLEVVYTDTDVMVSAFNRIDRSTPASNKRGRLEHSSEVIFSNGVLSDSRMWQLSSKLRSEALLKALNEEILRFGSGETCTLDVADGSLCTAMLISVWNRETRNNQKFKLISLETTPISFSFWENVLSQEKSQCNEVKLLDYGCDEFSIVSSSEKNKVDLLMSDLNYDYASQFPIDAAMVFYYQRKRLEEILSPSFRVIPAISTIRAMAIKFKHGYPTSSDIQSISKLDHSLLCSLWEENDKASTRVRGMHLFMYDIEKVSEATDIVKIDYQNAKIFPLGEENGKNERISRLPLLTGDGTVHACIFWVSCQYYDSLSGKMMEMPLLAEREPSFDSPSWDQFEVQFLSCNHQAESHSHSNSNQKQLEIEVVIETNLIFTIKKAAI